MPLSLPEEHSMEPAEGRDFLTQESGQRQTQPWSCWKEVLRGGSLQLCSGKAEVTLVPLYTSLYYCDCTQSLCDSCKNVCEYPGVKEKLDNSKLIDIL